VGEEGESTRGERDPFVRSVEFPDRTTGKGDKLPPWSLSINFDPPNNFSASSSNSLLFLTVGFSSMRRCGRSILGWMGWVEEDD
jgi:hypothetical protein